MEVGMPRLSSITLIIPALFGLSACVTEQVPAPTQTQVFVQPPAPQAMQVAVAPGPPPPPHAELVPPPTQGSGPVVWQPGHWQFTGAARNPWSWEAGQYVPPPPGETTWIPGRWMQQPTGGWSWTEGHWA
jgi:hypothetical protein